MAESALNIDLTFSTTDPDSRVSLYQSFYNFLTDPGLVASLHTGREGILSEYFVGWEDQ
jgi:hypothetical protein